MNSFELPNYFNDVKGRYLWVCSHKTLCEHMLCLPLLDKDLPGALMSVLSDVPSAEAASKASDPGRLHILTKRLLWDSKALESSWIQIWVLGAVLYTSPFCASTCRLDSLRPSLLLIASICLYCKAFP